MGMILYIPGYEESIAVLLVTISESLSSISYLNLAPGGKPPVSVSSKSLCRNKAGAACASKQGSNCLSRY